ncbi:MAG: PilZ domain-containing protein, partial [Pseudobdellovibrionaceae bacterium]
VASMTDSEMKVSWVHQKKWSDWKPLSHQECHELFLFQDGEAVNLPSLPHITQEDDHEITEVRVVSSILEVHEPIRRKHIRFLAKISVEIVIGTQSFPTHTLDLSEGGFCFADKLPDWVAGYFTVVLNTSEKIFEFNCFLAEDQKKDKFRAEIAPTTSEKVIAEFRSWLFSQNFLQVPLKK